MVQLQLCLLLLSSLSIASGTAAPVLVQWLVRRDVPSGSTLSNGSVVPIPIPSFRSLCTYLSRSPNRSVDLLVRASFPIRHTRFLFSEAVPIHYTPMAMILAAGATSSTERTPFQPTTRPPLAVGLIVVPVVAHCQWFVLWFDCSVLSSVCGVLGFQCSMDLTAIVRLSSQAPRLPIRVPSEQLEMVPTIMSTGSIDVDPWDQDRTVRFGVELARPIPKAVFRAPRNAINHLGVAISMLGVLLSPNNQQLECLVVLQLGSELAWENHRCCVRGQYSCNGTWAHSIGWKSIYYSAFGSPMQSTKLANSLPNGSVGSSSGVLLARCVNHRMGYRACLPLFPEIRYSSWTTTTTDVAIQTNPMSDRYAPMGSSTGRIMTLPFILMIRGGLLVAASGRQSTCSKARRDDWS
uniref:Cytochrome c biogenesis FC n=1 Tax=Viscum scurruloideum TaxID=1664545 RepID=A0A0H3WHK1_9MAGN|nr:cytochrome c biogenesis FC [Viscum scurruloideum]AKL79255.1 cytochrome c biogenesis FC [Viscum scurruloideum]